MKVKVKKQAGLPIYFPFSNIGQKIGDGIEWRENCTVRAIKMPSRMKKHTAMSLIIEIRHAFVES
jgi:hypothetical protein